MSAEGAPATDAAPKLLAPPASNAEQRSPVPDASAAQLHPRVPTPGQPSPQPRRVSAPVPPWPQPGQPEPHAETGPDGGAPSGAAPGPPQAALQAPPPAFLPPPGYPMPPQGYWPQLPPHPATRYMYSPQMGPPPPQQPPPPPPHHPQQQQQQQQHPQQQLPQHPQQQPPDPNQPPPHFAAHPYYMQMQMHAPPPPAAHPFAKPDYQQQQQQHAEDDAARPMPHGSPNYPVMAMQRAPMGQPTPMLPPPPHHLAAYPQSANAHLLKPGQKEAVEKLVGVPSELVPPQVMPQRRDFFEQLVLLNEQHGESLSAPPQVSKSTVDLHRLYVAVRKCGGFKKVCDDKSWKSLCRDANPQMTESSAAGYQLRRHYQKYLLALECRETGADMNELIQHAEKLKKKKKEKEQQQPGSAGPPAAPGTPAAPGPPTPGSIRSAATPTPAAATPSQPGAPPPYQQGSAEPGQPGAQPPPFYYQQHGQAHQQPQPHMYPPGAWPPPQPGPAPPPGYAGYPPHLRPPAYPPGYLQAPPQPQQQPPQPQQQQPQPPQPHQTQPGQSTPQPPPQQQQQQQQPQQQQQQQPDPGQGPSSAADQSSRSTPAPGSRPPSQAHYQPPTTPDSRSQPPDENRPASRQPPRVGHTPTPSSSAAPPPPPQPQLLNSTAPNISQPYQLPPGYRPVPPPKTGYPGYPEPAGFPPGLYPPGQHQYPGMWIQPPPSSQPSTAAQQHQQQQQQQQQRFLGQPGPKPQDFRRPQPPPNAVPATSAGPAAAFYPPTTQQGMPSPGSARGRAPSQQMAPGQPAQMQAYRAAAGVHAAGYPFPTSSLEGTATTQALRRKRCRTYARELLWATPKRLSMALRSGQELDTIWAVNTLTVLLYDDTAPPLLLTQEPQLLSLCLEHLRALLAVLYPAEFALPADPRHQLPCAAYKEEKRPSRKTSVAELHTKPKNKKTDDFTKVSRTGRKVFVERKSVKPFVLERLCEQLENDAPEEATTATPSPYITSLCYRVHRAVKARLRARRAIRHPKFSRFDSDAFDSDDDPEAAADASTSENADPKAEEADQLFFRQPKDWEVWDRNRDLDFSLVPRHFVLLERDPLLEELADRALALSNIVRGFSFFPGNEKHMATNMALLDCVGRLLILMVKEDDQQVKRREGASKRTTVKPEDVKQEEVAEEAQEEGEAEQPTRFVSTKPAGNPVQPERDSNEKLRIETANQLRDDAFTILTHLSVSIDFYNMNGEIAYRILDNLLHWAVTTNVQARDPIYPGMVSPKAYVYEIVCKMSLLETNIDLLLATGPWPRLEEFTRVVANSISMSEELPMREFAIVILTALCQASETVCVVAALETSVIKSLVSLLEAAEFNINTIATQEGVVALRENPERIGTSFGMLRRAAQILASFAQYEVCRPYIVRHQCRLLSFTVSSYMDSRVAAIVAGILYDVQHISPDLLAQREISAEESQRLADCFPSFRWKVSDDAEDPPEPFLKVTLPPPCHSFTEEAQKELTSRVTSPKSRSISPSRTNGAVELNGKSRKRSQPGSVPMSALERELLNDDSDTESAAESEPRADDESSQAPSEANSIVSEPSKSAHDAVKEKLRNNIMRHGGQNGEPEPKRACLGNGALAVAPQCNGQDLNNKVRSKGGAENGNGKPPPKQSSGSMAAVA